MYIFEPFLVCRQPTYSQCRQLQVNELLRYNVSDTNPIQVAQYENLTLLQQKTTKQKAQTTWLIL